MRSAMAGMVCWSNRWRCFFIGGAGGPTSSTDLIRATGSIARPEGDNLIDYIHSSP